MREEDRTDIVEVKALPKLTAQQRERLIQLEARITKAMGWFVAAGRALREINEKSLWRDGCATFSVYLSRRWGISRQRAMQLIDAVEVADQLERAQLPLPPSEKPLLALRRVPEQDRVKTWRSVLEQRREAPPEYDEVKEVAGELSDMGEIGKLELSHEDWREKTKRGRRKPEARSAEQVDPDTPLVRGEIQDRTGQTVTPEAETAFINQDKWDQALSSLNAFARLIRGVLMMPGSEKVDSDTVEEHIKALRREIADGRPYRCCDKKEHPRGWLTFAEHRQLVEEGRIR